MMGQTTVDVFVNIRWEPDRSRKHQRQERTLSEDENIYDIETGFITLLIVETFLPGI